ncbi:MAG: DUF3631 domain-containing protein [Pseudonocardiales bacterium]
MRQRAPRETVTPHRHRRDRPPLRQLAEQLTAWSRADLAAPERTEPDMPWRTAPPTPGIPLVVTQNTTKPAVSAARQLPLGELMFMRHRRRYEGVAGRLTPHDPSVAL